MFHSNLWILTLATIAFTVYVNHFWPYKVFSGASVAAYEKKRVCAPFYKCEAEASANTSVLNERCASLPMITCVGSTRCCTDCEHARYLTGISGVSSQPETSFRTTVPPVIRMTDNYGAILVTIGLCVLGIAVGYVIVIGLSIKRVGRKVKNLKVLRTLAGLLIVLSFLITLTTAVYLTAYVILNARELIRCQPEFIAVVMWTWTLQLSSVAFIKWMVTIGRRDKDDVDEEHLSRPLTSDGSGRDRARRRSRNRSRVLSKLMRRENKRSVWMRALYFLFHLLCKLTVITWIAIGIYFTGVRNGWWYRIQTWR